MSPSTGSSCLVGGVQSPSDASYRHAVAQTDRPPPWRPALTLRITCEFRIFSGHPSELVRRSLSEGLAGRSNAGTKTARVCTWSRTQTLATMSEYAYVTVHFYSQWGSYR